MADTTIHPETEPPIAPASFSQVARACGLKVTAGLLMIVGMLAVIGHAMVGGHDHPVARLDPAG